MQPLGEGPYPSVIYARGGNREYGQLRFLDVVRMLAMARSGRVVLAPEYRGEGGSEGEPELGRGDVDDVIAAVEALEAWPQADTERLALVGLSRGGLVAAWALTRSPRFDAAVFVAPSLDLAASAERRPELDKAVYAKSIAGYEKDRPGALRRASPIHAVDQMGATPILLLHGTADRRVHASVSLELSRRLLELDRPHPPCGPRRRQSLSDKPRGPGSPTDRGLALGPSGGQPVNMVLVTSESFHRSMY